MFSGIYRVVLVAGIGLVCAQTSGLASAEGISDAQKAAILDQLGEVGNHFEQNVGHLPSDVPYTFRASDYRVDLRSDGLAVAPSRRGEVLADPMTVTFLSARDGVAVEGINKLPFRMMHQEMDSPKLVSVPTFEEVRFENMYDGISLRYRMTGSKLEYDFEVEPGMDPSVIAMGIDGSGDVAIDEQGNLTVGHAAAQVTHQKPYVYQMIDGRQVQVDGSYDVTDGNTVKFDIGVYDASLPLVIDPVLTVDLRIMQ